MANQVHIVPHMHWDREWYFSAEESKLLLLNNMEEILTMLEKNDDYPYYVLDGQTALLEDYLALKPANKQRIKKLVQQGKLIIGPWYSQSDEMVVGGESIVRNLLYGHLDCQEFGKPMDIGYLPDSFGQSGQMPMILNGFNITRSMFWRGTSERMGSNKTEFYWISDDGSKVLTQLLPLGYAIGKYLPADFEALKQRCDKYMPVLDKGATSNHILIPNGHDQMPIQKDIFAVMEQLKKIYPQKNFFLSNYDLLFKELEKKKDYDILHGELLDGKYMRVHRSIFSSRADIKALNTMIENKITNLLEPLASIAYKLGFEYYDGVIESIWKEIMKNHAHDSIGCCCSDKVHQEIVSRFILANEKVDRMIDFYKRKITDAMPIDQCLDKLTVFNLLPYSRNRVVVAKITTRMKGFKLVDKNNQVIDYQIVDAVEVDPGLIDRQIVHYGNYDPFVQYTIEFAAKIPAMGYQAYLIKEDNASKAVNNSNVNILENEYYQIKINSNGTLKIKDLFNNEDYDNVLLIEDSSDDGDGYDYSPLLDDYVLTSKDAKANYTITKSKYVTTANIEVKMNVFKDLKSRKNKICDTEMTIKFIITLKQGDRYIDIKAQVNNTAKDHRVRVLIPVNLRGSHSVSDNQFGMITRPVKDEAIEIWQEENWSERPDSIYPMLSYVAIKDSPLALITNSIREYEVIGKNYDTLAITLFRAVGYLGKEELVRRPGRPSGIKMPTPDSQLLKDLEFTFALTIENNQDKLSRLAKEYLTPLISYNKMPYNAMKLNDVNFNTPYTYSLLHEENQLTTLSVLKKAEGSNELIYRAYNTNQQCVPLILNILFKNNVNLKEEKIESDNIIMKNQVKSFIIE